jgi:hypothetical protein
MTISPGACGTATHGIFAMSTQFPGTHTRASPSSTGTHPAETPKPKCAFNCSAVNPVAKLGVAATVPVCVVVVVAEGDAGRVVWVEEHPVAMIVSEIAAVR